MRSPIYLRTLALLGAVVEGLPQVIVDPGRSTITLPGGDSGYTLTIPGYSFPSITDITRTATLIGVTIGDGGTTTSTSSTALPTSTTSTPPIVTTTSTPSPTTTVSKSSTKISSSTSKSSSKTTLSTPTTSSTSSSSIKTTTSSTVSSTKTTSSSTSSTSIPTTTPPATTTTSTFTSSPTNPYSASCPIPSIFTVTDFLSVSGNGGSVSLTLSYGNGLFTVPNSASHSVYTAFWTLEGDDDGLTYVETDGSTWISIRELYWCGAIAQPATGAITLQAYANSTTLSEYLSCDTDADSGVQTCFQIPTTPFTIPVSLYGPGGAISFTPLDINGKYLSECVTLSSTEPIVTNTATCTTTPKPTSTITYSQTQTVIVGGGRRGL